jgi:hypothetical protein
MLGYYLERGCLPPYKILFVVDPRPFPDLSRHCETTEAENKIINFFNLRGMYNTLLSAATLCV